ncbi:visual pigment-like receptor peropsin [Diadema setosum]|uniref:visual pigment-like receptor peropsin n=1 Tax=Diadema setosum TaxID=31175 RepID=UPI003B3AF755
MALFLLTMTTTGSEDNGFVNSTDIILEIPATVNTAHPNEGMLVTITTSTDPEVIPPETVEWLSNTTATAVPTFLKDMTSPAILMEEAPGWEWSSSLQSWWGICQLGLSSLGIASNLLVMAVMFRHRCLRHLTDTLICMVAFADFFSAVGTLPLPIATRVPQTWLGELYCRALYATLIFSFFTTVSFYTVAAICTERYLSITHPSIFTGVSAKSLVVAINAFIYTVIIIEEVYVLGTVPVHTTEHGCEATRSSRIFNIFSGIFAFTTHVTLPSLVTITAMGLSANSLKKQLMQMKSKNTGGACTSTSAESRLLKANKKLLWLLFGMYVKIVVCFYPHAVVDLNFNFGGIDKYADTSSILDHVISLLAASHAVANPLIYTAAHPKFRQALAELFTCSPNSSATIFQIRVDNEKDKKIDAGDNSPEA